MNMETTDVSAALAALAQASGSRVPPAGAARAGWPLGGVIAEKLDITRPHCRST